VALQVLIDYKGFRISAQACLPIGKTTLKASCDLVVAFRPMGVTCRRIRRSGAATAVER
jgi:hypothetical protein